MNARRRSLIGLAALGLLPPGVALADHGWNAIDMTGISPDLNLSMTRARDGKAVTQADYLGKVVMLYFGYTNCPDICPLTLSNAVRVLDLLGQQAAGVRVLFVTVDPNRDTLQVLKQYAAAFSPEVEGLRGTPDALMALARRYRIAYSVTPAHDGQAYEVTHSSAIYVFDRTGKARLLVPSLSTQSTNVAGVAADLRRLLAPHPQRGMFSHLMEFFRSFV
jgi:protein SCO1